MLINKHSFLAVVLALAVVTPVLAEQPSSIVLNKERLSAAPITCDNTDYVPLRAAAVKLDYTISWDSRTSTASLYKDKSYITLKVGSQQYSSNNKLYIMVAPIMKNGSIYVPSAMFRTILNYDVYPNGADLIITSYTTTAVTETTTEATTSVPIKTGKAVTSFTGYIKSISKKQIIITRLDNKKIDISVPNDAKLAIYSMNNTVMGYDRLNIGDLVSVTLSPYAGTANIIRKMEL